MTKKLVAGVAVVAVLLAAVLALRGPTVAAADETKVDRLIQVSGTGRVDVTPDTATLEVAVETTGDTARAAQEENARAMRGVIDTLKKLGIAEKDVQSTQLSLYPVYDSAKPQRPEEEQKPPRIVGFRAQNSVQVTVRKLDDVGKVVDAVVGSGANRIQGISFGLSDPKPWQDKALEQAIADARRQAELAARAAGVQIRGVRNINVYGGGVPIIRSAKFAEVEGLAAPPPVMPGEMTIQVNVSMTFEF
ncbi:MAG: SIMPL domain-containing protein [Bacillota bacterium]|nr:SIMPL domain-containing protein [Bacillota bacterium]